MLLKIGRTKIFCMLLLTLFAATASAADFNLSMNITDKKAKTLAGGFHAQVQPGSKQTFTVTVTNHSKDRQSEFYLYPADAVPKLNGGKDFTNYGEEITGPGKWIKTKPLRVTLPPLESQNYSFDVEFPEDLSYGQYISYIALQEYPDAVTADTQQQEVNFHTEALTKIGIQLIADYNPGQARTQFSFSDFKYEYLHNGLLSVYPYIKNEGTILGKPEIEIKVVDTDTNTSLYKNKLSMESVYGGTEAESKFILQGLHLEQGSYKAVLTGQWKDEVFTKEFEFVLNRAEAAKSKQSLANHHLAKVLPHNNNGGISSLMIWCLLAIIFLLLSLLIRMRFKKNDERRDYSVTSEGSAEATKH